MTLQLMAKRFLARAIAEAVAQPQAKNGVSFTININVKNTRVTKKKKPKVAKKTLPKAKDIEMLLLPTGKWEEKKPKRKAKK